MLQEFVISLIYGRLNWVSSHWPTYKCYISAGTTWCPIPHVQLRRYPYNAFVHCWSLYMIYEEGNGCCIAEKPKISLFTKICLSFCKITNSKNAYWFNKRHMIFFVLKVLTMLDEKDEPFLLLSVLLLHSHGNLHAR